MAHIGQKFALGVIGGFGRDFRALQFFRRPSHRLGGAVQGFGKQVDLASGRVDRQVGRQLTGLFALPEPGYEILNRFDHGPGGQ